LNLPQSLHKAVMTHLGAQEMPRKTTHSSNALDDFSFTAGYLGALARADTLLNTSRWSVFADGGRYSLTGKFLPGKPLRKPGAATVAMVAATRGLLVHEAAEPRNAAAPLR